MDGDEFGRDSGLEKWRGDSATTIHMTRSKALMYGTRPSNDTVRIGDTYLIDIECVGTVDVVCPR